ncbi:MAG: hypothetical protein WDZ79_02870 [Candidatus Paceibacterota bacterium]
MKTLRPSLTIHHRTQAGQTMLVATIFFLIISLLIILGIANPIMRHLSNTIETRDSKTSYYAAESLQEDIVYRLMNGLNVDDTESLTLNGHSASAVVTDTSNGKNVRSTGDVAGIARNVETTVVLGDGITFNFGVQADQGGILLENSAKVIGNVYANGPIVGEDNMIHGSAVSAGPAGLIENVHATGSIYAHTIKDAWTERDAYYFSDSTITNTTVEGTRYPDSEDQATSTLPISDEKIDDWKAGAEAGGTIECEDTYDIKNNETIGPVKIPCDLEVSGNDITVTIGGPVWVEGNIVVSNRSTFQLDPSLGAKSVAIIADDPDNRDENGSIELQNRTRYYGTGEDGSYIMLISQNTSEENGGGNEAIIIKNFAEGDLLLYAGHGRILLENNISLKEVTAYTVHAKNSAEVIYETGLASLLFDSGPGASYAIQSWREVE